MTKKSTRKELEKEGVELLKPSQQSELDSGGTGPAPPPPPPPPPRPGGGLPGGGGG